MSAALKILQRAAILAGRQGSKVASSFPTLLGGFYGNPIQKGLSVGKGAVKGAVNLGQHTMNPTFARSAEVFKDSGVAPHTISKIEKIRNQLANLKLNKKHYNPSLPFLFDSKLLDN